MKSAVLQLVLFDSKPRRCSVAFLNWIDQRFRKQRRYSAASCSAALASSRYAAACGFRRALSLSGATAPFSVREFAMCRPCVTPELGFTLLDSLVAGRSCLRALVVACLDARLEIVLCSQQCAQQICWKIRCLAASAHGEKNASINLLKRFRSTTLFLGKPTSGTRSSPTANRLQQLCVIGLSAG